MGAHDTGGFYAKTFELLARNPTGEHKVIARKLFLECFSEVDMSADELCCDEALCALGLAQKTRSSPVPSEVTYEYLQKDGSWG